MIKLIMVTTYQTITQTTLQHLCNLKQPLELVVKFAVKLNQLLLHVVHITIQIAQWIEASSSSDTQSLVGFLPPSSQATVDPAPMPIDIDVQNVQCPLVEVFPSHQSSS